VNFRNDDIVHARQNTIDSCLNFANDRHGYVLEHRFTQFSEILPGCQQVANVPNGVEISPKISIAWVGCTNVTDDRQTDGRWHTANVNASSRSLKMACGPHVGHNTGVGHSQEFGYNMTNLWPSLLVYCKTRASNFRDLSWIAKLNTCKFLELPIVIWLEYQQCCQVTK